jgi:hypothetical protein
MTSVLQKIHAKQSERWEEQLLRRKIEMKKPEDRFRGREA